MKLSVHISLIRVKIITMTQVGLVILEGDVLVHLCNERMHSDVNLYDDWHFVTDDVPLG